MEIRPLEPTDDLKKISEIYIKSWRAAYQGVIPEPFLQLFTGGNWVTVLEEQTFSSLVLLEGDAMIGTAAYGPARDETFEGWGELVSLYLLPEFIGKGYGKQLLNQAIKELEAAGFANIYLWVLEENRSARKFYQRQGFEASGDTQQIIIAGKTLTELRYIRRQ